MSDVQQEYTFTTDEEFQVLRKTDGAGWRVYDFEWELELFYLPPQFTEDQVRVVCSIVNRRMNASLEWGKERGRADLQHQIKTLLGV